MGGRRVQSHSLEDAGPEHDDSADEGERNGRCEQTTSPDADLSHHSVEPGRGWICNVYVGAWFKISLHLTGFLTPKDGSCPPLCLLAPMSAWVSLTARFPD